MWIMFRQAFPRCEVPGPVDPVPYSHFCSNGCIPRKCSTCKSQFEGGCGRGVEQTAGWLALDHGPCAVPGPSDPVLIENRYISSKVSVPRKCSHCRHLDYDGIRGFVCGWQQEMWGDFPRTLDWGDWTPETPNVGLDSDATCSPVFIRLCIAAQMADAIRTFLSDNPTASVGEGKRAYEEIRRKAAGL